MKTLALFFFLFASLSLSVLSESEPFQYTFKGSVSNNTNEHVAFGSFDVPRLGSPLGVSAPLKSVLCILENVRPSNNPTLWNEKYCDFFFNFTTTVDGPISVSKRRTRRLQTTQASFNPAPGLYHVALTSSINMRFEVLFEGSSCLGTSYGLNCSHISPPLSPNTTEEFHFTKDNFFSFELPPGVSSLKFDVTATSHGSLFLRAKNAPFDRMNDDFSYKFEDSSMEVHKAFEYPFPAPGTWYGEVPPETKEGFITFAFDYETCNETEACPTINHFNLQSNTPLIFNSTKGKFEYFEVQLNGSLNGTFSFSAQNKDGSSPGPTIFARYAQFPAVFSADSPFKSSFDATMGEQVVNTIHLEDYTNGTWYFVVLGNGKDFAVWANSDCPSTCLNGNCVKKDDLLDTYVCECHSDYEGFDCSIESDKGFKTEYIVLIVIGSIIALAALLGLLVYLYNRGRHPGQGYEKI